MDPRKNNGLPGIQRGGGTPSRPNPGQMHGGFVATLMSRERRQQADKAREEADLREARSRAAGKF